MRTHSIAQGVIVTRSIEASEVVHVWVVDISRLSGPSGSCGRSTESTPFHHADTPAICALRETALIDAAAT
jgi:hypothetical protein